MAPDSAGAGPRVSRVGIGAGAERWRRGLRPKTFQTQLRLQTLMHVAHASRGTYANMAFRRTVAAVLSADLGVIHDESSPVLSINTAAAIVDRCTCTENWLRPSVMRNWMRSSVRHC